MTLLVGIDVGTSAIKVVISDPDGRQIALASVTTPNHVPRPGWAFQRADELWDATVRGVRQALEGLSAAQVRSIAGVAVTSVGEAGVLLDDAGKALCDVIAWYDTRTQGKVDWLEATYGLDRLFAVSGLSLQPIWTLLKLLWLRDEEPEAYRQAHRWLNVADYIAFRLSGQAATDFSLASRTHAMRISERAWATDFLTDVGINTDHLPPIMTSGTALGPLTGEAASETGLPAEAKVAVGGHDHVVGALGVGVVEPGQVLNSLGSAEALFWPLSQSILDPRFGAQGYSQGAHVVPDRFYAFGGQYTAGAAIEWMRSVLAPETDHSRLIEEASSVPPGCNGVTFLPHLRIASPPIDDPRSRGAYVGLSTDTSRGTVIRATYEGLAFASKASLDGFRHFAPDLDISEIVAIGGVSKNQLLMEIKATTLDLPISVADATEGTALGAAMLAGIGAGVYRDTSEAIERVSPPRQVIQPRPEWSAMYQELFEDVYQPLYPALRDIHHRLASIGERAADEQEV